MFPKCYQRRLIPLAFVASVLEKELQYHGLAVCVNSRDDAAKSSKNLMNFYILPGNSRDGRTYLCTSGMTRPYTGVGYIV